MTMWTDLTPCPSPKERGVPPSPLERARGEVKEITPFPSPLKRARGEVMAYPTRLVLLHS